MAVIDSYPLDASIEDADILIGTDSSGNITKNFSIGSIKDYIALAAGDLVDTNYYVTGATSDAAAGTVLLSITGAADQTITLGTAAFSAIADFADVDHSHTLSEIVVENAITTTQLNVTSTGDSGQVLTSDGSGGFNWVDSSSVINTNNYLTGISKSGNTLTFDVNGSVTDPTFEFGEGAFLSLQAIESAIVADLSISDFTNDLGDLAVLDTVSSNKLDTNAVVTDKIANSNVTVDKLKISNSGTSGQVLTYDGSTGFTWATNSASNYYLSNVTKSGETLTFEMTGGLGSGDFASYTFGSAAFKDTGTGSTNVATGNHTHLMADITNAGALATLSTVGTSEIANNAVSAGKLSPSLGTDGQVLGLSNGALQWQTLNTSNVEFITLPDTPSTLGTTSQVLRMNSGATALEFLDLSVAAGEIKTTNSPSSDLLLGVNSNGDLEWVAQAGLTNGSITPVKFNGIADNGTAGQIIKTDGDGTFSYTDSISSIDDLSDVDITGVGNIPSNGQALVWNSTTSKFEPGNVAAGSGGSTVAVEIDTSTSTGSTILDISSNIADEDNTQIYLDGVYQSKSNYSVANNRITFSTAPPSGTDIEVVHFKSILAVSSLNDLTDVDLTTNATDGQYLIYDSTTSNFEPSNLVIADDAVDSNQIADGAIDFSHLANEFKTVATAVTLSSSTTTATNDFSTAAVFPITLASDLTNTTITYSNTTIGQTKILKVTGSGGTGSVTITGTKLAGTLDQTSSTVNYIQVTAIGASEYIYTISQA